MGRYLYLVTGIAALLSFNICAASALPAFQLTPYHLTYEITEGAKGQTVRSLVKSDEQWVMSTDTDAKITLINAQNDIETTFIERDSEFYSLSQTNRTKAAFVNRTASFDYDNESGQINWVYKKKSGTVAHNGPLIDDSTMQLEIVRQLKMGEQAFSIDLFRKNSMTTRAFKVLGTEKIDTALGQINTVKVARTRKNSKKQTLMYYAPALNYTLVRIDQLEDGEALIIMLKSGDIDGTPVGELLAKIKGE